MIKFLDFVGEDERTETSGTMIIEKLLVSESGSGEETVTVIRQVQNLLLPCLVRQSEVFEGMSPYLCSFKTDSAGLRRLQRLESEPVFILHCFKQ